MPNERRAVHTGSGSRGLLGPVTLAVLAGALACSGGGGGSGSRPQPGSPTLSSIALTPAAATASAGGQQQFVVTGTYSDGSTAPITSGIEWSSSNPSVATMGSSGIGSCTNDPTSAGTTTITATVAGLSAQATLTVTPAALLSVTIEPPSASVPVPATQAFAAIGHYANGAAAPLVGVTWTSSDVSLAVVDGSGFAQGVKKGSATITATDVASGKSGTASFNVTDPVLLSISVSPATASIPATFHRKLTAIGHYSDGQNPELSGVTWASSDTGVATVTGSGDALGVAPGSATLTATHVASGLTSTAALTITAPVTLTALTTADLPFHGSFAATGALPYKVTGLAAAEYLVRLTSSDPSVPAQLRPTVEVHPDASFAADWICSSWAGGPPCRAGSPNASGEIFVLVAGATNQQFTLDVQPLPVLVAGGPAVAGTVDRTETYYKITGLTAPGTFTHRLTPADLFADLFTYDRAGGPFGFTGYPPASVAGFLCSTATATGATKTCTGAIPLSGATYVTVEGWLTDAGTAFTLTP